MARDRRLSRTWRTSPHPAQTTDGRKLRFTRPAYRALTSPYRGDAVSNIFADCVGRTDCFPLGKLERAKGFEPSTPTLARLCSTPELRPLWRPVDHVPPGGWRGTSSGRWYRQGGNRRKLKISPPITYYNYISVGYRNFGNEQLVHRLGRVASLPIQMPLLSCRHRNFRRDVDRFGPRFVLTYRPIRGTRPPCHPTTLRAAGFFREGWRLRPPRR